MPAVRGQRRPRYRLLPKVVPPQPSWVQALRGLLGELVIRPKVPRKAMVLRDRSVLHWIRVARMSNLTVTIDDDTLKRARVRAVNEGTSVNELIRRYLESYAAVSAERNLALEDLLVLSRKSRSRHQSAKRWRRDELHDR